MKHSPILILTIKNLKQFLML